MTRDERIFHNEELHNLFTSPNITVTESRRLKSVGMQLWKMRNAYKL
jgi:hypothetical protein